MPLAIRGPLFAQAAACEPILRALPAWFGIEEAVRWYVHAIDGLPTWLALDGEQVLGFVSLRQYGEYAAEIQVMGVRPECHRRGIGRMLLTAAQRHLGERGVEYLQVKTLSPAHPDPGYARTRAFYAAMGFRPLEEFPTLWGDANPCLQLVKRL